MAAVKTCGFPNTFNSLERFLDEYCAVSRTFCYPTEVRIVEPGGSIQAAIDESRSPAFVLVKPGVYTETVTLPREENNPEPG